MKLTGNTRHRPHVVTYFHLVREPQVLLVLQVEYENRDFEISPHPTLWRDARVQDLAELERLKGEQR